MSTSVTRGSAGPVAPVNPSTGTELPEPTEELSTPEWVSPVGELINHALRGGYHLTMDNRPDDPDWIDWCHDSPATRRL
jgi:hypothetical protein